MNPVFTSTCTMVTLLAECLWPGDKVLEVRPKALSSNIRTDFSCCNRICSCSICNFISFCNSTAYCNLCSNKHHNYDILERKKKQLSEQSHFQHNITQGQVIKTKLVITYIIFQCISLF